MSLPPESLPPYYMQRNGINNRVTHSDRPWLVLVKQADGILHAIAATRSNRGRHA